MSLQRAARRYGLSALCALTVLAAAAPPAAAQDVTVTGGIDFLNRYMFRGIRQNGAGMAVWPWVDLGVGAYSGEGDLKSVTINLGTWNSVHSDPGGWYESDLYAALTLAGSTAAFTTTYTSYTSPDDRFTHVKEIMFKVAMTDNEASAYLKPYATVAVELGTSAGVGQADAGAKGGTYLELGVAPSASLPRGVTLAIPVKFGFSLGSYYEHPNGTGDTRFGYGSLAGIVTIPAGPNWNVHGGLEYQRLGVGAGAIGGGRNHAVGSIGVGFAY